MRDADDATVDGIDELEGGVGSRGSGRNDQPAAGAVQVGDADLDTAAVGRKRPDQRPGECATDVERADARRRGERADDDLRRCRPRSGRPSRR